jgi:predicted aminopeptidase
MPDDDKRRVKKVRLQSLSESIAALFESAGHGPGRWLDADLNNARLASMALYEGRLPEFRALFERCEQRIDCFYEEAKALAGR